MHQQNIQKAIQKMKAEMLNASWKKLWLEVVHDYKGFSPDEVLRAVVDKAVSLAQLLGGQGFQDMTLEDINDFINAYSQLWTDKDLTQFMMSESVKEEEEQENPAAEHEEGLTSKCLATSRVAKELRRAVQEWYSQMMTLVAVLQ